MHTIIICLAYNIVCLILLCIYLYIYICIPQNVTVDILITDKNIESLFNLPKLLACVIPSCNEFHRLIMCYRKPYLQVSNSSVLLESHFKLTLHAPFPPQLMIATFISYHLLSLWTQLKHLCFLKISLYYFHIQLPSMLPAENK